ncbi:MAG: FecCD family ABC transporter permease [Thermoleophilia bacterium]
MALIIEHGRKQPWLILLVLAGLLGAAFLAGTATGAVFIAPVTIMKMIAGKMGFHLNATWTATDETIFFQIRMARVVTAGLVGAALAVAGVLFQGLLRNPLADPYLLGTSGGAALAATISMITAAQVSVFGFGLISLSAFLGALAAALLVYHLARVGGQVPAVNLLLAGFAVGSLLTACMSFLITVNPELQFKVHALLLWLMGGVMVTSWQQISIVTFFISVGIGIACTRISVLNALSLGEEGAAYLGINVERQKIIILVAGSLLTGAAVSVSGLVGFVALIVPHGVRLVIGPNHRLLLPAVALSGATFLILADMMARIVIAPSEMPLGVLTALIGGPFFIYLLRRSSKGYRF